MNEVNGSDSQAATIRVIRTGTSLTDDNVQKSDYLTIEWVD